MWIRLLACEKFLERGNLGHMFYMYQASNLIFVIEDADKFFESRGLESMEFMSFAPRVRKEWAAKLPGITHVDDTARLQVVNAETNGNFYQILTEFSKISETPVLLNTSFNIRGRPILSRISDALEALSTSELDAVVIEDVLFEKSNITSLAG